MYFDNIVKHAESPIAQKVFSDKDEEMFVSIFKADGDDDTGESLENPDEGNAEGGSQGEGAADNGGAGESLENPGDTGNQDEGNGGPDMGGDNGSGESLENPGEGSEDDGSGNDGDQGGNQDGQSGESLENPDASGEQGGQDQNAQPPQENSEDASENKIKDINERILLFRKHRKLEDTVQVLSDSVSAAISQVVTSDSRLKLIKIQKDLLVTKGQIEYAISLDFKTINMEKASEIYKIMEKKVALMSDTLKKIRKENADA